MLIRRLLRATMLSLMLVSSLAVGAASALDIPSIGQSFQADDANIVAGALVSLQSDNAKITLSTSRTAVRLAGVVGSKPLVAVSDGKGTVQVVTEGTTLSLVSDINGAVRSGDHITASPVNGVGMKIAASGVSVGTAQADLSSVVTQERSITDQNGVSRTVHVGAIPVRVHVAAIIVPADDTFRAPSFLQHLGDAIAGKPISAIRIWFATLIFCLLFVAVTVLLYGAIRSSIISIGRNPFSEGALRRALLQTGGIVGVIVVCGLVVMYLILKL